MAGLVRPSGDRATVIEEPAKLHVGVVRGLSVDAAVAVNVRHIVDVGVDAILSARPGAVHGGIRPIWNIKQLQIVVRSSLSGPYTVRIWKDEDEGATQLWQRQQNGGEGRIKRKESVC